MEWSGETSPRSPRDALRPLPSRSTRSTPQNNGQGIQSESSVILFQYPRARIVSFATTGSKNSRSFLEPPVSPSTLTERTIARGVFKLYRIKAHNNTSFLQCGDVVHPILKRLRCWKISRNEFILPLPTTDSYWRIEIQSCDDDVLSVLEHKLAESCSMLRYAVPDSTDGSWTIDSRGLTLKDSPSSSIALRNARLETLWNTNSSHNRSNDKLTVVNNHNTPQIELHSSPETIRARAQDLNSRKRPVKCLDSISVRLFTSDTVESSLSPGSESQFSFTSEEGSESSGDGESNMRAQVEGCGSKQGATTATDNNREWQSTTVPESFDAVQSDADVEVRQVPIPSREPAQAGGHKQSDEVRGKRALIVKRESSVQARSLSKPLYRNARHAFASKDRRTWESKEIKSCKPLYVIPADNGCSWDIEYDFTFQPYGLRRSYTFEYNRVAQANYREAATALSM
ncbi:inheritance of peroxisomes protein 1-domain-containing protein [Lipomyces tetrasporus]|uniref:Inheritance of peroxisomes protein 1 n=1 Tax=Lipomyces tetrasporus TaxID=54092 RepID=A0AAD7QTQ4_9ASCO|nr:inheritance of peroxisomes protein 1-domain-containing protein [Lipomyces tetrasporus]KAJ8101337.1 inheritance of peroxisomes protein 1-domain-containing protein [Lipomyces tetrasporus]